MDQNDMGFCVSCRWFKAWEGSPEYGWCRWKGDSPMEVEALHSCWGWEPKEEEPGIRRVPPRPQDRELIAELTRLAAKGVGILF